LLKAYTSDGSGIITDGAGSAALGINLPSAPDTNAIVDHNVAPDFYLPPFNKGAKIWLVPSEYYDATNKKMNSWSDSIADKILFETGLINYTYTTVPGGESVGLITTIIEPIVGISVTPETINFGNVMIGHDSSEFDIFITNTGNIPAKITTLVSAGFYTDCLWLKYPGGWVLAKDWSYTPLANGDPPPGVPITVKAVVHPTAAYATATLSGTITFLAEMAP
jgi:hypothetical protein